jgi:PAS domain-containing protein
MTNRFGIREKLLAPIIIGLSIIIFTLFFIWQPNQLNKDKQDFIEAQTRLLKTLTPSIIQNILSHDLAELHSIFEHAQLIHEKEWRYIELYDQEQKQLYPIFSNRPDETDTLLKITHPIEENDEIFGSITLYTDWSGRKQKDIKNINQLTIIFVLLFIGIAILTFTLLTKWIYTPITALKNITSEFSKNNYDITLPKTSADEIGDLTRSVDMMRRKIQSNLKEIIDKEKMQRAIVDSVPDAIITINAQGIIQSFNPGAENIFQYKSAEVIGCNVNI